MQRDALASHLGHHSRLVYFAAAENQTMARMKFNFLMVKIYIFCLKILGHDQTCRSSS